jgi:hypothetical protein
MGITYKKQPYLVAIMLKPQHNVIADNGFAAWRRLPNGCLIFATNFLAAFAKPLLCAGRFISTKFNLKTK